MEASPKLPSVFAYIDFKKYLGDYYEQRKIIDPGFTHVYICHRLGQARSRGYFNNVLKGRIPVSSAFVDRFISLLGLKANEGIRSAAPCSIVTRSLTYSIWSV